MKIANIAQTEIDWLVRVIKDDGYSVTLNFNQKDEPSEEQIQTIVDGLPADTTPIDPLMEREIALVEREELVKARESTVAVREESIAIREEAVLLQEAELMEAEIGIKGKI